MSKLPNLIPGCGGFIELAPGVGFERDVLSSMQFCVKVSEGLVPMDTRLFQPPPMGIELRVGDPSGWRTYSSMFASRAGREGR